MADVFISYAREDTARAEVVAHALEAEGIDVFWDSEIPPGQTWADYIESKLNDCKAVIVLWSANSTRSQWVREEARMGRDKGKLIPAALDDSAPPFGFGEVQAANLKDWTGQAGHADWERTLAAVRNAVARPAAPRPATPPPEAPRVTVQKAASFPASAQSEPAKKPWFRNIWVMLGGGAVAVVALLGVIGAVSGGGAGGTGEVAAVDKPQGDATPTAQAPTETAAPGQNAPDYRAQLENQLAQAAQIFAQQGYQAIGQPYTSGLAQGGVHTISPVTLEYGGDYRILAVCDHDCRDIDLQAYDQNNQLVAEDVEGDDHPVLAIAPRWTGPFSVHVSMAQCAVAPCYFAAQLYGRPLQ